MSNTVYFLGLWARTRHLRTLKQGTVLHQNDMKELTQNARFRWYSVVGFCPSKFLPSVYFRQKLLNFSLAHCEPNAIEALLHSRSLLQTEVLVLILCAMQINLRMYLVVHCVLEVSNRATLLMPLPCCLPDSLLRIE